MKSFIWNLLTVLVLLGVIVESIFFLAVYTNPYSSLNPFPPPSISTVTIPATATATATETTTPFVFPSTWTPTLVDSTAMSVGTSVLVSSSTPKPSDTTFVLPSFTPYTPSGTIHTATPKRVTEMSPAVPSATLLPSPTDTPVTNYDQSVKPTVSTTALPTAYP